MDDLELDENIKRVRREEQEALLNAYVDSQASLGDYYEGDPFYAGMTTDALDDGEWLWASPPIKNSRVFPPISR